MFFSDPPKNPHEWLAIIAQQCYSHKDMIAVYKDDFYIFLTFSYSLTFEHNTIPDALFVCFRPPMSAISKYGMQMV